VALATVAVEASIAHGLATTRLDLELANDEDRVLEGEVVLPLPEGAIPCSFALDVNGEMREASVVEREQARSAFESTERRRVDPGLVEWSNGSSYRVRVYPIPAHGKRRARLVFAQEAGECFSLALGLPLRGTLSVDGLAWPVAGDVDARLPRLERPDGVVDEEGAFFARIPLGEARAVAPPARATVLYDASLSLRERDREKERAILERVLAGTRELRLVVFAHEVLSDERFASAGELLARLAAIEPDGAARLSCLDLRALERETDAVFLLSDGSSPLGGTLAPGSRPITSVTSAPGGDRRALARVGRVVDVRAATAEEAVRRILSAERVLVRVEGAEDVLPAPGTRIEEVLSVAGHAVSRELAVTVREDGVERTVRVPLEPGAGAARCVACRRLDAALSAPVVDVAAVVSLARVERLVTPCSSFVVLETLADYRRFGIEPPPGLVPPVTASAEEHFRAAKRFSVDLEYAEALKELKIAHEAAPDDAEIKILLEKTSWIMGERRGGLVTNRLLPQDAALPVWGSRENLEDFAVGYNLTDRSGDFNQRASGLNVLSERIPDFPGPRIRIASPAVIQRVAVNQTGVVPVLDPVFGSITAVPRDPARDLRDAEVAALASTATAGLDARYFAHRAFEAGFFASASDVYLSRGLRERGVRVLTSLAALDPGDPVLLRVLAYRLEEAGARELALSVLERVAELRPREPQSFRDVALAAEAVANVASAAASFARALALPPDGRYPEIEAILARELLHATVPSLVASDLRVVLTWDANDCDVDLWVTEPSGEKVFYSHPFSASGARLSRDFTQGYGPEELVLEHAPRGDYLVQANFYGDRRVTSRTETTIRATIFTNYGRPGEARRVVVRRLGAGAEVVDLARVKIGE
jgi:tetratricopeptide (TPR) repeat protein